MKNLIWIASYPKSGNTWVRLFLRSYIAETNDINASYEFETKGDLTREIYDGICENFDDLDSSDVFLWRLAAFQRLNARGYVQFVKTHSARSYVNEIPLIPPQLTRAAIYIIRDPRDVAISFARHLGVSVDEAIRQMASEVALTDGNRRQPLGTWSGHVESWGRKGFPVLLVRYEKLFEPEAWRRILEFIGEDIDEERFEKAIEGTKFENLQKQEEEHGFKERPPTSEKFFHTGKSSWHTNLTASQIKQIEADHGKVMKAVGYVCHGSFL